MKPLKIKNPGWLLLSTLLLLPAGCGTTGSSGDVQMTESRHFPKKPNFTIKQGGMYQGMGLDFNAVYFVPPLRANMGAGYNYMRFWPNGRVLVNEAPHVPTRQDAENFSRAYLGYYQVANSNIVAEFYIPTIVKDQWDYMRELLVIQDGNVLGVRQEMNGRILESHATFQKLPLGQLQRLPDW